MTTALMKRIEALEAEASTDVDVVLVLHTNETGLLFRHAYGAASAGPGRDQQPGEDRAAYLVEMHTVASHIVFVEYVSPPPKLAD